MAGVITLTTDFGVDDTYVGVVKGVILSINPRALIVDLCHNVAPQDILRAGLLLNNSYRYFPFDSVHLAVVDPGVGTERKAIILKTVHPPVTFVAPDNGLLSLILMEYLGDSAERRLAGGRLSLQGLEANLEVFDISNPRFWLHPVSSTFHGRDIFAPVTAYLSLGYSPAAFGQPVSSLVCLPSPVPVREGGGVLRGKVMQVDHFGNLITNIKKSDLPGDEAIIEVAGRKMRGLKATYAGDEDLVGLIGSSGYLEIALRNGNAARHLKASIGDGIVVRPEPGV